MTFIRFTFFTVLVLLFSMCFSVFAQNLQTSTPIQTKPAPTKKSDQNNAADFENEDETSKAVTAKVIEAKQGHLIEDKPVMPAFYFKRRVYQKKGISVFKQYVIKDDGSYVPSTYDGPTRQELLKSTVVEEATSQNITNTKKESAITLTSPSGKWQVLQNNRENFYRVNKMLLKNIDTTDFTSLYIPFWEWGGLIGWNPKKDLFYYWTSGGSDTGRQTSFYQFDPISNIFTLIGSGGCGLYFSPNGDWAVWVNGDGMDYSDRQIVTYNVATNKNYVLTSSHSDNLFDVWAGDPLLAKWFALKARVKPHVDKGRKYFFAHDFDNAISEYQKAIEIDPKNYEAYDLMGYSYYREGKLDEARKALLTSINLDQKDFKPYYNYSLVEWAQNQHLQAVLHLGVYIKDDDAKKRLVEHDSQFKELVNSKEYQDVIINKSWKNH